MAAPVLNSVSPSSGPPGSTVTCLGSGFTAASRIACPVLVATTLVDAGTLTGTIPVEIAGEGSMPIGVYVVNGDGSRSAVVTFTVVFGPAALQSWTTVQAVAGEIPGFVRGGKILDAHIETWMRSVAQSIAGALLKRGLSTDPSTWQQPDAAGEMSAASVLEMINRLGAASRLATAVASQFGPGQSGLSTNLGAAFSAEMKALRDGDYDKLFRPGAATVESGPLLSAADLTNDDGTSSAAFTKGRVF
jgi:hypothetical protein